MSDKRIWSCDVKILARLPDGREVRHEFKQVLGSIPDRCREDAIAMFYEMLAEWGVEPPVPILWAAVIFNFEE